jgi:hypothetical protein
MSRRVQFDVLALAKAEGFEVASAKVNRLSEDAKKSNKNLGLLSTTIVGLGPALVPIGAAAVAAGAGLAGLGATGILAFKGIKREMAAGTLTGQAYTAQVSELQNNLHTLEATAARGVLVGFQKSVADIQPLMPLVNKDIGVLSGQLGDIESHVMPGLVTLFTRANPLFVSFGDDLVKGSAGFEKWAGSSDGVTKFVRYAQQELPQVEATVLSLAKSAEHLVVGIAPLGGGSLSTLRLFSDVVSKIPVGVIQALAPALAGLKVASTVNAGLGNLSLKLGGMGAAGGAASKVAGILGGIGSASFVAAPLLLTLASAFGNDANKAAAAAQETQGFTDALKSSHGAIDQNIRSLIAQNLQQSGVLDAARKLGIALPNVTDAVLHQSDAQRIVNGLLARYPNFTESAIRASGLSSKAYEDNFNAADKVIRALRSQSGELDNAKRAYQNETAATAASTTGVGKFTAAVMKVPGYRTSKIQVDANQALAQIKTVNDRLDDLNGKTAFTFVLNTIETVNKRAAGSAGTNLAQRQAGGPVTAGMPYLVGEVRPEVFIPDVSGHIMPRVPGGNTYNITVNAPNLIGGTGAARLIAAELERYFAGGGTLQTQGQLR